MSVNVNGTLVKVDEATKYFKRGSEEIHVLEKLDMQVPEGEFANSDIVERSWDLVLLG